MGSQKTEPKEQTWHGVTIPTWAVNPRFVQINDRTFTVAIDPDKITMEMKANWNQKYIPELAAIGKKVLESLLKEKVKTL